MPRWLSLLLIAAALLFGFLAVKRAVNGNADFNGNYRWWKTNLRESTLPVRRTEPEPQDPDSYPPITYAIHAPLGAVPLWAAATLWYVMNVACSIHLWWAARRWLESRLGVSQELVTTDLTRYLRLEPSLFLNLSVLAILPFWIGCVLLGQNTLPLMSLTWAGFQAASRGRHWLAGALLALATVLKVLPVVYILPFVICRNSRVVIAFSVTGMLLVLGLGSLFFGPRTNWNFHQKWLQYAVSGSENRPPDPRDPDTVRGSLRYHNQAFESVLARLMMDVPIHNGQNAARVNLWKVAPETWRLARSAVTGMCVLLGLVALVRGASSGRRLGETSPQQSATTSLENYSLLCLLQLFISPIVWSHYYLWLFWPLLWILASANQGRQSGYALFAAWALALPLVGVPYARAIGVHLWLTVAMYVWICWPNLVRWVPKQKAGIEV